MLPPSLARFSPCDPDTIVYVGYGLERCVQFYSISSRTVFRTLSLTHWSTCFAISPQSHLLAFGSNGTFVRACVRVQINQLPIILLLYRIKLQGWAYRSQWIYGATVTPAVLIVATSMCVLKCHTPSLIFFLALLIHILGVFLPHLAPPSLQRGFWSWWTTKKALFRTSLVIMTLWAL